ncbi:AMP-binding protein [Paenactinomyces guangxiensis]|uniref:acetate--CoA ligase n=1 Tax=Paenactinomyces guangxiensis TaxID=1490290 RepID=A0A7W2A7U7_9BACL|nr:AMP-binding protein [Paenactinomyces guangxiensis]MBA4494911.1 AMP-binding protein [Paenactinomyces guangxiensis]MBH8591994.1 AMP-binding protein [Paenactinomyces guangxiensis]
MSQPVWVPKPEQMKLTRLYRFMNKHGYSDYDLFYEQSVRNIAWLWDEVVKDLGLEWIQPYRQVMDTSDGIAWTRWFVDGKINVAANCLDRFVKEPASRHRLALIWEGDNGETRKYTYRDLWVEVNRFARGLKQLGVGAGDRVAIYLPMIAENVIAMLAVARIGAIFTPCFSGYGAEAVATRIRDCEAKILITADGFLRRGKVIAMKEEADRAADLSPTIEKVVVVKRLGRECPWNRERDVDWGILTENMKALPPHVTDASDPFMIIYTSGTTGKPKGTVHVHSGFPVKAAFDAAFGFDVGPGDILFWVTDMGWMMGPWMVFGALMVGSTMLVYEGTPDHPAPDRLWQLVAKHGVTHLGISPTLVRALMKHGETWVSRHDISSLRVFGSTGEPWNPDPWYWLFEKVGHSQVPIFNYSGGTEISGGILGNNLLKPLAPCGFTGPLPGMDADVFDENGQPVRGRVGELVLRQPWVGMASGFWQDDKRYEATYWNRWPHIWVHGDWVEIDEHGFWFITGRSDDTLKIAGKRLGPAEMESVLVDHPAVLEAATIGVPDQEKGETAVCFVVVKPGAESSPALSRELIDFVSAQMGKALKPKRVHMVNELPKTRNGKILRRVIRAVYLGEEPGDLSSLENAGAVEVIRGLALKK